MVFPSTIMKVLFYIRSNKGNFFPTKKNRKNKLKTAIWPRNFLIPFYFPHPTSHFSSSSSSNGKDKNIILFSFFFFFLLSKVLNHDAADDFLIKCRRILRDFENFYIS